MMRRTNRLTLAGKGATAAALALGLALLPASVLFPTPACAQEVLALFVSPFAAPSVTEPVVIHGFSRTFAPKWRASYGIGRADQTALSSSLLRYDHTLAYGTRSDGATRNDWRHFLGLEYAPVPELAFSGGIAKVNGNRRSGVPPSGYERLRMNLGARWMKEDWGVEGTASFIPTGAGRIPHDAGYLPGTGGSGPTYFFSLTISRRF